jgi:porin
MRGKNERHTASIGLACLALSATVAPARAETGSLWSQPSLFDTPGGLKQGFREAGINLDVWLTNFGQGVISGDGDPGIEWGNKGDLLARFDGEKPRAVAGSDREFSPGGVGRRCEQPGRRFRHPRQHGHRPSRASAVRDHDTSISVTQAFGPAPRSRSASSTCSMPPRRRRSWAAAAQHIHEHSLRSPDQRRDAALHRRRHRQLQDRSRDLHAHGLRPAQCAGHRRRDQSSSRRASRPACPSRCPRSPAGSAGFYSLRGVYSTKDGLDLADVPQLILPPEAQDIETKDGYWFASASAAVPLAGCGESGRGLGPLRAGGDLRRQPQPDRLERWGHRRHGQPSRAAISTAGASVTSTTAGATT